MKILAGGPARETSGPLFEAHKAGLEAQEGDFELEIRHEVVEDPGGPRWTGGKIEAVARVREEFLGLAQETWLMVHVHESHYEPHDYYPGVVIREVSDRHSVEEVSAYDALFMVDTDVILGPGVLERLLQVDAPVVYGVFWTTADWGGPVDSYPQVWDINPYGWTPECADALREDGVNEVEVYGGGACTLIRERGFESRYWPLLDSLKPYASIMNQKSLWAGEDRTFGLGCELRGIRQVAVTGLPIRHCYNTRDRTRPAIERAKEEVGV